MPPKQTDKRRTARAIIASSIRRASNAAELEKRLFWVVVGLMVGAYFVAVEIWEPAFEEAFQVDEDHRHVAGLSLAVSAMSLVAAGTALWNLLRVIFGQPAVTFEVPNWMKPYLAPVGASLVGILIGTTIFK